MGLFLILQWVNFIRILNSVQGSKSSKTSQSLIYGFPQEVLYLRTISPRVLTLPYSSQKSLTKTLKRFFLSLPNESKFGMIEWRSLTIRQPITWHYSFTSNMSHGFFSCEPVKLLVITWFMVMESPFHTQCTCAALWYLKWGAIFCLPNLDLNILSKISTVHQRLTTGLAGILPPKKELATE